MSDTWDFPLVLRFSLSDLSVPLPFPSLFPFPAFMPQSLRPLSSSTHMDFFLRSNLFVFVHINDKREIAIAMCHKSSDERIANKGSGPLPSIQKNLAHKGVK